MCVVGRREAVLQEVEKECRQAFMENNSGLNGEGVVLTVPGDFANPQDMVRVREKIEEGEFYLC